MLLGYCVAVAEQNLSSGGLPCCLGDLDWNHFVRLMFGRTHRRVVRYQWGALEVVAVQAARTVLLAKTIENSLNSIGYSLVNQKMTEKTVNSFVVESLAKRFGFEGYSLYLANQDRWRAGQRTQVSLA